MNQNAHIKLKHKLNDLLLDSKPSITIVIVGRPNVGKSSLFNRLFGKKRALVHDIAGVTRDRLSEKAQWWVKAKPYTVEIIDTGGVGGEHFRAEIDAQVEIALKEADIVLWVLDGQSGVIPADLEVLRSLHERGLNNDLPFITIMNKIDADMHEDRVYDAYTAGVSEVMGISAEHNRGIDELKERILELTSATPDNEMATILTESDEARAHLKAFGQTEEELALSLVGPGDEEEDEESEDAEDSEEDDDLDDEDEVLIDDEFEDSDESEDDEDLDEDELDEEEDDKPVRMRRDGRPPRIAIVGKPNSGKSTFTNALLGEDRMIVSPIAGTTVDAIDTEAMINGKRFILVDTAGIRRKNKTEQGVEVLSVVQTRKALERSDLAILMIDGIQGLTDQDEKIGGIIEDVGTSVVIAINKWDEENPNRTLSREKAAEQVRQKMAYLRYAPLFFMSAKNGEGFEDLGDLISDILVQRQARISTREFSDWVRAESEIHNPGNVKFYLSHQTGRNPPTFVSHVSQPNKIHFSLSRHLVNAIRAKWGFAGTPLRLIFKKAQNRQRNQTSNERKKAEKHDSALELTK